MQMLALEIPIEVRKRIKGHEKGDSFQEREIEHQDIKEERVLKEQEGSNARTCIYFRNLPQFPCGFFRKSLVLVISKIYT